MSLDEYGQMCVSPGGTKRGANTPSVTTTPVCISLLPAPRPSHASSTGLPELYHAVSIHRWYGECPCPPGRAASRASTAYRYPSIPGARLAASSCSLRNLPAPVFPSRAAGLSCAREASTIGASSFARSMSRRICSSSFSHPRTVTGLNPATVDASETLAPLRIAVRNFSRLTESLNHAFATATDKPLR
jgi:hypothetical protein